nr:TolC family protein [Stieleria neptunia]
MFCTAASAQMPSMSNTASAIGRTFTPPPPVPSAPYGLDQLDPSGPLFPGVRVDGSDFGSTPAPVYVDGEMSSEVLPMEAEVQGYRLDDFLTLAAQNNPTIRQARLQISAQTAKALQAGLYPNPTLNYIGEQIGVMLKATRIRRASFRG